MFNVSGDGSLIWNVRMKYCVLKPACMGAGVLILFCAGFGCGWLFVCPTCRKAFTFARAEEVALTWEELAHKDLDGKWGRQPSSKETKEWISFMKILLKDLKIGEEYVYIDGWVWPTDSTNTRFDGWHAHHELVHVPQFAALTDRSALD